MTIYIFFKTIDYKHYTCSSQILAEVEIILNLCIEEKNVNLIFLFLMSNNKRDALIIVKIGFK